MSKFTLTHAHLIAAGMPAWDVVKFRLEWPNGAEINSENLDRAYKIGLCVHTLFAAVCPTKAMLERWYKYPSGGKYAKQDAERKRHELAMKEIEKMAEDDDAQHKCDLLIKALTGSDSPK